MYAWWWDAIDGIASKVFQNNLFDSWPSLIKINIIDGQVFPGTAHICTVETKNEKLIFWSEECAIEKYSIYLNKRSSISGNERYSSSTKSTNDERVVFKTRKSFRPLITVGRISDAHIKIWKNEKEEEI